MGIAVFGHWGLPMLAFPTSHGDEWELQRNGLIDAIADYIDAGRVKVFCVGSNNHESFLNSGAHPFHRSWRQRLFDEYIRDEVVPFIHASCQTAGIPITTMGASMGAYHASNTLFRYPHMIKRCYALSGVFDLRRYMDGMVRRQLLLPQPRRLHEEPGGPVGARPAGDVRDSGWPPARDHGKRAGSRTEMSGILARKGIKHHLDDWGPRGGHDWPYWKDQMREYLAGW